MAVPTFVFINDFGGFSVLTDRLDEVINSMVAGGVTHAVIALGYWDFKNGQVTVSDGASQGYQHSASFYTNVINQMHAAGLQVIAWMMDGAAYDPSFGQVNLDIQYLPLYLPYVKQIMDMGFDGFCDDIEYWLWTDTGYWQLWSAWENALCQYLHNASNFADGRPRISCPAIGPYNNIAGTPCIGSTLQVDYNLIMFYMDESDPATEGLWYLDMLGQYTANPPYGDENGDYPANPFTPLSPVILIILVHGGPYDVGSGYDPLAQINYYTDVVSRHPIGKLAGFGIWVWENINYRDLEVPRTNPTPATYWSTWNNWVTNTLPALGVPEYDGNPPPDTAILQVRSTPIDGIPVTITEV